MRRLRPTRPPTGESHILPEVPRPTEVAAGSCPAVRALLATLRHAGRSVSYDAVMGLTGIAFMLPLPDDTEGGSSGAWQLVGVPAALTALGLHGECRLLPETGPEVLAQVSRRYYAPRGLPLAAWELFPTERAGPVVLPGA